MKKYISVAAILALLPFGAHGGPHSDNSWDIAVMDRALAHAKPGDPWVKFGDVGIKYADLKAYRDRLAEIKSRAKGQSKGQQPNVVTPPGTVFKWPSGNVNYRFDPIGLTNGTIFKMTTAGVVTTLHTFNGSDGRNPLGALVRGTDGNYYGTTQLGGTSNNGTVFKITTGGTFTTLYSFAGMPDGSSPAAGLIQGSDGNFYGTTQIGGTNNLGTVFKITSGGTLTILYSFGSVAGDGANPVAPLVQGVSGDTNLYGTTQYGGNGLGTVFKITTAGSLTTLRSFSGGDGSNPVAGLVHGASPDTNFYGTTQFGGTNGAGTVFKITNTGTFSSIHSFDVNDGYQPVAGLIQGVSPDTNLYGTTQFGGTSFQGTVFKITTAGVVTTLHSFVLSDGQQPVSSLVQAADTNFYGTVFRGGTNADGTTFKITSGGSFTLLHTFVGTDGTEPAAGMVQGTGGDTNFYGTTPGDNSLTASKMQQFRDGIAEWAAFANLHFIEFSSGAAPANFVSVRQNPNLGGGFSSSVGMAGGEQFVECGPNAWNRGTACHEMGHALGLYHEQQRDDRDTYIVIITQNIIPGQEGNFATIPGGSTEVGAYDFYSIMHYERNALSIDPANLDTIHPQPAYNQFLNIMGRVFDRTLSKLDRAGMAQIYGNPSPLPSAIVTNTNDSGSGSLRAALYYAYDKSTDMPPVPTSITFNIPAGSAVGGVFTIKPTYPLVAPGASTTIDGATQAAFTGNTNPSGPEIVIDGSLLQPQNIYGAGFLLREMNCAVKNLVINGFDAWGILIDGTRAALFGTSASGNVISGCYLGTDKTGSVGVANSFPGVEISGGAHDNLIGGTSAAARNIISGNNHYGVTINAAGSNNNVVIGNYIGVNAAGTGALSNAFTGVAIYGGAQNNTIGGTASGARNVISGNGNHGIYASDAGTTGNSVLGNYIGTNAAGTAAVGNTNAGVGIFGGAQSNFIGGTAAGAGNVISGNLFQGIFIADTGTKFNLIQGNTIGPNAAQTDPIPNTFSGIDIFGGAQSNTIGGLTSGTRNLISGNLGSGIQIQNAGTNLNLIQGNYIGTNGSGTTAIANGGVGVGIFDGSQSNTIGGLSAGAGNLISGNSGQGIAIAGAGANQNLVQGNFVGVNAAGTAAVGNGSVGVNISGGAQNNTVGGTVPAARNIISGNAFRDVQVDSAGTSANVVAGNFIGLNAAGLAAIANNNIGVGIFAAAQNNTIGGTSGGSRNFISGHAQYGILVANANTSSNLIQGNTIGLNIAGAATPNTFPGVAFDNSAQSNTLGGTAVGASNIISGNANEGVAVYSFMSTTIRDAISRNSIFANGGVGIALYDGGNNTQPSPALSSAILGNTGNVGGTDIGGTLTGSAASTAFTIEFFANPPGGDEGQFFVGSASVMTNGGGTATFTSPPIHLSAAVPKNYLITATATDPNGNTSQFSSTQVVTATDSDGDGMPDSYEAAHPGATDPNGDNDGDGLTNLQEMFAGTAPLAASNRFQITLTAGSGNDIQITFRSVVGKTYRLEYRNDLIAGSWLTLSDQIFATATTTQVTDASARSLGQRYYRVLVEP